MAYRTHRLLVELAYTHLLACTADFAVVCGISTEGLEIPLMNVLPEEAAFHVHGGFKGIPFKGGLGAAGERRQFQFAAQVSSVVVVTTTEMTPSFIPLPPAPKVTIVSTELQGYSPRSSGSVVKVLFIMFSDGSSDNYSQNWRSATPSVGTPQEDLEPRYAMLIYGGPVVPDNPFDPNGPKGPVLSVV